MIDLDLQTIPDQNLRNSMQKVQDFLNNLPVSQDYFQPCEISVTENVTGAKLSHKLGGIPKDAILSRLIAPSAAKLKFRFSDFTSSEIVYDVTGLASGETLNARFLVGSFPDSVSTGTTPSGAASQELKGAF